MKQFKKILIPAFIFLLLGCEKTPEDPGDYTKENLTSEYLYDIMNEFYLWTDYMPKNPDLSKSPVDLLEDLRYTPLDKWSFILTTEEYNAYYEEGQFTGYGFGFEADASGNIRVTFVFDDSPLKAQGVKRGWIIKQINSTNVNSQTDFYALLGGDEVKSHTFTFEDFNHNMLQYTFEKDIITMNTVLLDTVYQMNNQQIGYLIFKSFIETSEAELKESFKKFKQAGIDELIVDLRYNGGGRADVSLLLGGLIGGSKVKDQMMVQYIHNSKQTSENKSYKFTANLNSVEIDRVFFITTRGTASASEMLINGLDPFMDFIQIGDDTHGKPAGMYGWTFKDYTVLPISFLITNAEGKGDYFNGLPVNAYVDDDLTHDFGDTAEYCLKEALYYIDKGTFSPNARLKSAKPLQKFPTGLRFEIGAI